jgi:hypothetical protein
MTQPIGIVGRDVEPFAVGRARSHDVLPGRPRSGSANIVVASLRKLLQRQCA